MKLWWVGGHTWPSQGMRSSRRLSRGRLLLKRVIFPKDGALKQLILSISYCRGSQYKDWAGQVSSKSNIILGFGIFLGSIWWMGILSLQWRDFIITLRWDIVLLKMIQIIIGSWRKTELCFERVKFRTTSKDILTKTLKGLPKILGFIDFFLFISIIVI